jgi:hypothetical protein
MTKDMSMLWEELESVERRRIVSLKVQIVLLKKRDPRTKHQAV